MARGRVSAHAVCAEHGAHVPRQVHCADEGGVQLARAQRVHADLERAQPGGLLARDRVAGTADAELACDAAGHDAAERTHGAVGGERRHRGFAQRLVYRPAKVEVRRVEVEGNAYEHARAQSHVPVDARVGERTGHHVEHEELLGQHLLELLRRNAKAPEGNLHAVEIVAAKRIGLQPAGGEPGRLRGAPPAPRRARCLGRCPAQHPLLEGAQVPPGSKVRFHAHDGDRLRAASRRCRARRRCGPAGLPLLQQQVGVDAAEAKRAQRSAARHAGFAARPRPRRVQDLEGRGRQPVVRRALEVRGGRQRACLEGQQQLGQAGGAGRRQQMADVRLHRADHTGALLRRRLAPERAQARELGGVPGRRGGAVALDQVHVRWGPARLGVRRTHRAQLSLGIRGHERTADVVAQSDAADDGEYAIALALRVAATLEQEQPGPLADHQSVGALVEGRAHGRWGRARAAG